MILLSGEPRGKADQMRPSVCACVQFWLEIGADGEVRVKPYESGLGIKHFRTASRLHGNDLTPSGLSAQTI